MPEARLSIFTGDLLWQVILKFRDDLRRMGITPAQLEREQLVSLGARGLKGISLPSKKHVTRRG